MDNLLIEAHYFPCLKYVASILLYDNIYLEAYENYQKQSFRNRTLILGSQGIEKLIVPIINPHKKTIIKDIKIDNSARWKNQHWKTICSLYGKAPFFIYYKDEFQKVIFAENNFLFDLNSSTINTILNLLRIKKKIFITDKYDPNPVSSIDLRNYMSPTTYNSLNLNFNKRYIQVFGEKFVPNLSILDLLMCKGPDSLNYLTTSK